MKKIDFWEQWDNNEDSGHTSSGGASEFDERAPTEDMLVSIAQSLSSIAVTLVTIGEIMTETINNLNIEN